MVKDIIIAGWTVKHSSDGEAYGGKALVTWQDGAGRRRRGDVMFRIDGKTAAVHRAKPTDAWDHYPSTALLNAVEEEITALPVVDKVV